MDENYPVFDESYFTLTTLSGYQSRFHGEIKSRKFALLFPHPTPRSIDLLNRKGSNNKRLKRRTV